jgi:hypothetical protein
MPTPETPTADVIEPVTGDPTPAPEPTPDAPVDLAAELEKWKGLSRKHEDRAKANADAAAELAKIREANMTEDQKRAEREASLVEQNAGLAAELARTRAAVTHGLTAEDLEALEGIPADKVEAVAARLAARTPVIPKAPSADGQGKVGNPVTGPTQLTRDDLKGMTPQAVDAAREAGQLRDLMNPPNS